MPKSNTKKSTKTQTKTTSRLGMGLGDMSLDTLLPEAPISAPTAPGLTPVMLTLSQIKAGAYQPRVDMKDNSLQELAESITMQGIIQPITVRQVGADKYEIIAGERRYRAAKLVGLEKIPAIVRDVDNERSAVMALVENMQREDLNPMEEAHGLRRLLTEFKYTHEQAAQAIGRSRSGVSNLLRLLQLAEPVQTYLQEGRLDLGHGKVLASLGSAQQILVANQVVNKGLSVRETEQLVQAQLDQKKASTTRSKRSVSSGPNPDLVRMERALSDQLSTHVSIKARATGSGQLVVNFHDWEHLNGVLESLGLKEIVEEA